MTKYIIGFALLLLLALMLMYKNVQTKEKLIADLGVQVLNSKELNDSLNKEVQQFLIQSKEYHDQLNQSESDLGVLRDRVAHGAVVYVRGACKTLPQADNSSGAAESGAVLDPIAREDYFNLRSQVERTEIKLMALQGVCY